MTVVFNTKLGQLVQTNFGINEIASSIVVGKAVGSVLTRLSEAAIFAPLATNFDLAVEKIPEYLQTIKFERSGTIFGSQQRKLLAKNVLEQVHHDSLEGIATFMVLILRHLESVSYIVDYLEDLLRGEFWIVARHQAKAFPAEGLPYSLKRALRNFVTAVSDADADSAQTNLFRESMTKLAAFIGNSSFMASASKPSLRERKRFLSRLLGNPRDRRHAETQSDFDTFSADAAVIALAAAANGAQLLVSCETSGGTEILFDPGDRVNGPEHVFTFQLWLVPPPPSLALHLRNVATGDELQLSANRDRCLPFLGGNSEIARLVAKKLACQENSNIIIPLWQNALEIGYHCPWKTDHTVYEYSESTTKTVFWAGDPAFLEDVSMPSDLSDKVLDKHQGIVDDPHYKIARKAASLWHLVVKYPSYDRVSAERFATTLDFVTVALFTGCVAALFSNTKQRLSFYAWTADPRSILTSAIFAFFQGISPSHLIRTAATIWGGTQFHEIFRPEETERSVGIVCPQTTILLNVLVQPLKVAELGLEAGLLSLHEGSIPMIPHDQVTGLILGGRKHLGGSAKCYDTEHQKPATALDTQQWMFTLEPETVYTGGLVVLLCGWHHGCPILEMDPLQVLFGLIGQRGFREPSHDKGPEQAYTNFIHIGSDELTLCSKGFRATKALLLVRTGSRPDLQVAAAGSHLGTHTIMIVDEADGKIVRERQDLVGQLIRFKRPHEVLPPKSWISQSTVLIYCLNDLPPHPETADDVEPSHDMLQ